MAACWYFNTYVRILTLFLTILAKRTPAFLSPEISALQIGSQAWADPANKPAGAARMKRRSSDA
jgi:hypothetical protein